MKTSTLYYFGEKQNYLELIFLAEYYLWNYKKSNNATGFNSPIDGNKFNNRSNLAHHEAHKQSCLAMAKSYLKSASELRKGNNLNILTKSVGYYNE